MFYRKKIMMVHNFVNILHMTKMYTLKGSILRYVGYISILKYYTIDGLSGGTQCLVVSFVM